MRRVALELGRVRALEPRDAARVLDDRELHAEADPEERDLVGARVADRLDLPLGAAVAEATGDEDGVDAREELVGALALDLLGVDVLEVDLDLVCEAAVDERLVERLVRVLEVDVLADDADLHGALRGLLEVLDDALPGPEVRAAAPDVEAEWSCSGSS